MYFAAQAKELMSNSDEPLQPLTLCKQLQFKEGRQLNKPEVVFHKD